MSADFWAGYVSGAAGIVIGNPLDLIKVRLQAGEAVGGFLRAGGGPGAGGSGGSGFASQFESVGALVRGESPRASAAIAALSLLPADTPLSRSLRRVSPRARLWRAQRAPIRVVQPHADAAGQ